MSALWAGIDAGKKTHHAVVMDAAGTVVLTRRVDNDEHQLLDLIAAVLDLAGHGQVTWGTDLSAGGAWTHWPLSVSSPPQRRCSAASRRCTVRADPAIDRKNGPHTSW